MPTYSLLQRKGGLLSTKVNRPFSVIHTTSLANIDRSYSPEKCIVEKPEFTKKAIKRTSGDNRRKSPRLSGNKKSDAKIEMRTVKSGSVDKSDQENQGLKEKAGLKKPLPRMSKDEKVPKKKMRRSNTYSNVSGTGLVIPVINGEMIDGLAKTEDKTHILKEQINKCNVSGFEIIDTNTVCHGDEKAQSVVELPSFLQTENGPSSEKNNAEENSFVEVDSLEMENDKCHSRNKSNLEHSFVEINSETFESGSDLKRTYKGNENAENDEPENRVNTNVGIKSTTSPAVIANQGINKAFKNSALRNVKKENSFLDSLNDSPSVVEPPSFLSPDSFVEDAMKYKLRSAKKGRQYNNVDGASNVNLTNPLDKSRPVISPDTFIKETSAKKLVTKDKDAGNDAGTFPTGENERFEKEIERRETFIKKCSSPRFSVPAVEVDFRRGTFVKDAKKAKLLEKQQPSEASPRRTTFTVIKKTSISALKAKARARSDESPRTPRRRTRSQTKAALETSDYGDFDKTSAGFDEREETDSVERPVKVNSGTVTKSKCEPEEKIKSLTNQRLFSEDSLEENCNKAVSQSDKQMDNLDENEENCLELSHISSKNSTYEVSANKSILLNQTGLKNDSFPSTPHQLPTSPNPDHSRRSTHIVEKPKVLDLSIVDRKQLFPRIVDYEEDSTEDKSGSQSENVMDEIIEMKDDIQSNDEEDDNRTKPGTRRLSARKSWKKSVESTNGNNDLSDQIEIKSIREIDKAKTNTNIKSQMRNKELTEENADNAPEKKETGQLFFVPIENKPVKELAKPVRSGPHTFLKKRSNTVVQNEDRKQAKRIKSETDSAALKAAAAKREPKTGKPELKTGKTQNGLRGTQSKMKAAGKIF